MLTEYNAERLENILCGCSSALKGSFQGLFFLFHYLYQGRWSDWTVWRSPSMALTWWWVKIWQGLRWQSMRHHQISTKHRKNCETALSPGIPSISGIPGLWNLADTVKLAKIVKFGGNYEIGSISLVWMSLIHNNELMVRLGTFIIVFVFVVVFLLVRSCFLITLI